MRNAATIKTESRSTQGVALRRAESRLDLTLHFEALFENVLQNNDRLPHAMVAEALAEAAVSWIERYDAFTTEYNERPAPRPANKNKRVYEQRTNDA
jgi:hypothetical protein